MIKNVMAVSFDNPMSFGIETDSKTYVVNNLITHDNSEDLFAVHRAAGTNGNDLRHRGLLLGGGCQDDAAFRGLLSLHGLEDDAVC